METHRFKPASGALNMRRTLNPCTLRPGATCSKSSKNPLSDSPGVQRAAASYRKSLLDILRVMLPERDKLSLDPCRLCLPGLPGPGKADPNELPKGGSSLPGSACMGESACSGESAERPNRLPERERGACISPEGEGGSEDGISAAAE